MILGSVLIGTKKKWGWGFCSIRGGIIKSWFCVNQNLSLYFLTFSHTNLVWQLCHCLLDPEGRLFICVKPEKQLMKRSRGREKLTGYPSFEFAQFMATFLVERGFVTLCVCSYLQARRKKKMWLCQPLIFFGSFFWWLFFNYLSRICSLTHPINLWLSVLCYRAHGGTGKDSGMNNNMYCISMWITIYMTPIWLHSWNRAWWRMHEV